MTLLTIAELLSGETHLSYGGLVDAETAFGWDLFHWDQWVGEALAERGAGLVRETVAPLRRAAAAPAPDPGA